MDHTYIEENQVADRYVQGTLPADEADRFENHYLSCPECLDRLDLAESVQRGFRRVAAQDAAQLSATRQLALLAWLARLSRRGQAGVLLSALLVLTLLPAGLGLSGIAGRDRELARTRATLAGERAAREQAVQQLAQTQTTQANVPIVQLDRERGAGSSGEAPTQSLRQPRSGMIVLAAQVDEPFQPSYSARLQDAHDREIMRWTGLHPDGQDNLTMSLAAVLLPPADYVLIIEGPAPGAKPAEVGRFAFRVVPPQG